MFFINSKIKRLLSIVAAVSLTSLVVFCVNAKQTIISIEEKEQKNDQNMEEKNISEKSYDKLPELVVFNNIYTNRVFNNKNLLEVPLDVRFIKALLKDKDKLPINKEIREKLKEAKKKGKKCVKMAEIRIDSKSPELSDELIEEKLEKLKSDILEGNIKEEELEKAKKIQVPMTKIDNTASSDKTDKNESGNKNNNIDLSSVTLDSLKKIVESNNFSISKDSSGLFTINTEKE